VILFQATRSEKTCSAVLAATVFRRALNWAIARSPASSDGERAPHLHLPPSFTRSSVNRGF